MKFRSQNPFWPNLGPKSQSCHFCLKICTHGISKMLILIPTLVFWISNSNSLFGQIWAKKVKVVHFNWNWHTWYLESAYSKSGLWNSNPKIHYWANLGRKSQSCPFFPENFHAWHLHDADSYSNICDPKSILEQIWAEEIKAVCFAWKLAHTDIHTVSRRCWFLFPY